jgi:hypothetical protein
MAKKLICNHGLGTDGWVSLDPADLGLIEGAYKKNLREGEERLLLAVLESAVEYFQKYVLSRNLSDKKLFQEAEDWFLEKDNGALFSFESICQTLELHPEPIWKGLLLWKEARLKTPSVEVHRQRRTKSRSTRISHVSVRLSKTA